MSNLAYATEDKMTVIHRPVLVKPFNLSWKRWTCLSRNWRDASVLRKAILEDKKVTHSQTVVVEMRSYIFLQNHKWEVAYWICQNPIMFIKLNNSLPPVVGVVTCRQKIANFPSNVSVCEQRAVLEDVHLNEFSRYIIGCGAWMAGKFSLWGTMSIEDTTSIIRPTWVLEWESSEFLRLWYKMNEPQATDSLRKMVGKQQYWMTAVSMLPMLLFVRRAEQSRRHLGLAWWSIFSTQLRTKWTELNDAATTVVKWREERLKSAKNIYPCMRQHLEVHFSKEAVKGG